MKKTLTVILLLALTLTLASCGLFGSQIESPSSPPPVHSIEPVSSPSPEATPTSEPSATPSAPSPTPDIVLDEIFTQFYDEPQYEYISADYGIVVPYVGYAETYYTDAAGNIVLLGFASTDGKVICEPIFSNVRIYWDDNTVFYSATETYEDENGAFISRDLLINQKGEVVFSADEISVYYGAISFLSGGKYGVADLDGNILIDAVSAYYVLPASINGQSAWCVYEPVGESGAYEFDYPEFTLSLPEDMLVYAVDDDGERVTDKVSIAPFGWDQALEVYFDPLYVLEAAAESLVIDAGGAVNDKMYSFCSFLDNAAVLTVTDAAWNWGYEAFGSSPPIPLSYAHRGDYYETIYDGNVIVRLATSHCAPE